MILTPKILTESAIARQEALTGCDRDKALALLAQTKAYTFGTHTGKELATTAEVAEFYEIPLKTIQKIAERNRQELTGYGLKTFRGKELDVVTDTMSLSKKVRNLTLWTPTATLAVGLMLEVSSVALNVRKVTITAVIGNPPPLWLAPRRS